MILSPESVVHYLIEQNLLEMDPVVDGDVAVVETSRRNRNFKVNRRAGAGLFVKQIQSWQPQAASSLQREAICYWMAAKEERFGGLVQFVPRYRHYDPARSVLVTDLLANGESLAELHQRLGSFPPEIGAELGGVLAACHAQPATEIGRSAYRGAFLGAVPWILSFHQQSPGGFQFLSSGNTQLLGVLRQYPDFEKHLNELSADWRRDTLIHGDMKWDNCHASQSADGTRSLRIVDWELADVGDAAWDVGAVFQAYLSHWIFSMPVQAGVSPDRWVESAPLRLESMQPSLRAFWEAYRTASPERAARDPGLLGRSVRSAAARMIQTVYEYMHRSPQLTGNALCLLQASFNMLAQPGAAQRELLGLEER